MSLENKLRKLTQGQKPAAVVDELAVQPPQEPENVADDHREQIINNLSDEDIPLPAASQIPWAVISIQQTNLYCVNIFIRSELFHSSSDSEEKLIPIALRILGIFLVMNFL
jgi:hypothetical protein